MNHQLQHANVMVKNQLHNSCHGNQQLHVDNYIQTSHTY